MKASVLIRLIIFSLTLPVAAAAVEPFETLTVSAGYVNNINRNRYHDFWHPAHGGEITGETPFYFGRVETGLQLTPNRGRRDTDTDYLSIHIFIGWSYAVGLKGGLEFTAGFRLGNYYMRYDDDNTAGELHSESELAVSSLTRLRFEFRDKYYIWLGLRYRTVYTSPRIYHGFIALGLSHVFDMPGWLRGILE